MFEVAQEDAFTGMELQFTAAFARGTDPDATAKGTEVMEIFASIGGGFKGGDLLVGGVANGVMLSDIILESKGPETSVKIASSEFSTESVANMAMRALDETILMRGVRTSGKDIIFKFFEEETNFRIIEQFTALVEVNILVLDSRTRGISSKKSTDPGNGGTFSNTSFAVETSGEVIAGKDIACLAVESSVVLGTILGLGALSSKSEVEAKALVRNGSFTRSVVSWGAFLEFGLNANGTSVEDGIGVAELGNTVGILVGIIKMLVTNMIQALMPEKAFSRYMELLNLELRRVCCPVDVRNEFVENQIVRMSIFGWGRISTRWWIPW